MLSIAGLSKQYGTLSALKGVGLEMRSQGIHGLIGPNGSGKSTLLKCLSGAHLPTSGSLHLSGRDITRWTPAKRARAGISMKFQITAVFPDLSVYDNLLLALQADAGLWALGISSNKRLLDARVEDFLARLNLRNRGGDLASTLSHGQQQWLEIGMALAREPKVLLLDEPTAGMSPQERRSTGEMIKREASRCSVLLVEHDLDFVREICDSLTVLDQGSVVASGPIDEVIQDPRVREAYLQHA